MFESFLLSFGSAAFLISYGKRSFDGALFICEKAHLYIKIMQLVRKIQNKSEKIGNRIFVVKWKNMV